MKHLFCFGFGYSARALADILHAEGWTISGTARSKESSAKLETRGFMAWLFNGTAPIDERALDGVTHLISSAPPNEHGDPVTLHHAEMLARRAAQFEWAGYLSTTGVYGDRGGDWVTEQSALEPSTSRGEKRLLAETQWLRLFRENKLPVHLFRLAGIYGPDRNQFNNIKNGTARRIIKAGQVFSRIHRDDIAGILKASIGSPRPGAAYNVCDNLPAPPQDVISHAAALLGVDAPPSIDFEDAELSPMARSFYAESKRVSNDLVKSELGYDFKYPDYRAGLASLLNDLT